MSLLAFLKGFALAGLMALGFALGVAWEHREGAPGILSWIAGRSLAQRLAASEASITTPVTGWSARLATCERSRDAVSASLTTQNAAVAAMKAQGEQMTAASVKAVQAAQKSANAASALAAEIVGRTPASSDLCQSAYQLVRDYAR